MLLQQGGLTLKKKKPNLYERTGAVPQSESGAKVLLPGGAGGRAKSFTGKHNFDKIKKKYDATGKLDREDFNNTQDMGLFIDWCNNAIKGKSEARASEEILEISKFLVNSQGRTTFIMGDKKV